MYVYNHDDDRLWRTTMMTEYDAETSFSTNVHAAYIKTSSAKCWADQQPRRSRRETSPLRRRCIADADLGGRPLLTAARRL